MKSVRFYGIRDTRVEDVDVPKILEKDDVIIKVKVAGICGSDISKYSKTGPHMVGEILGHEFSGEVAQVGKEVRSFKLCRKRVLEKFSGTLCPAEYIALCNDTPREMKFTAARHCASDAG